MTLPSHPILRRSATLWQRLTEPAPQIIDPGERRLSHSLASLFLALGLVVVFILTPRYFTNLTEPSAKLRIFTSLFSASFIFFCYALCRKGHYQQASLLAVAYGSTAVFFISAIVGGSSGMRSLYYLVVVTLYANLFLSQQATLSIFALQLLGMSLLPVFVKTMPAREVLEGPVCFNIIITVTIHIFAQYRQHIETQRRNELAASENQYRNLFENVHDVIYTHLTSGEIVSVNPAILATTGFTAEETLGRNTLSFIHPDDVPRTMEVFQRALKGEGTAFVLELRLMKKDGGHVWMEYKITPNYQNGSLISISGIGRDVTARREAESQIVKFAVERERIALLSRLVEAISHDFRTSLANIEASRYLIKRMADTLEIERFNPKLDNIQYAVSHMADQLENLHVVTSLAELENKPLDLNRVVERVVYESSAKARDKGLTLQFEPDKALPSVKGDSDEVKRAVKDLVVNAVNYTHSGGNICLRTYQNDGYIAVEVSDTGIGIDPEHIEHIFDFFYRADAARAIDSGGVGLGLSIVKMIAEAHRGNVQVRSTPGQGSTFTLTLPISQNGQNHA